jgi:hypothetical protein
MIDVTGKNSEQIRQEIGNLSSDELVEIYEQPLLNYLPDLDEVTQKLGDWIIDI